MQVSSYSFESHTKTSHIRVFDTEHGTSHIVSEDASASDPVWIAEKEVLYVKSGEYGSTMIMTQRVLEKSE